MPNNSNDFISVCTLSVPLLLFNFPPVSAAQNETDKAATDTIERIIVSARKRGNQSIQDIGGSIQTIIGEDLETKAALGFNDYMRLVPGLSANNSGSSQTQITI